MVDCCVATFVNVEIEVAKGIFSYQICDRAVVRSLSDLWRWDCAVSTINQEIFQLRPGNSQHSVHHFADGNRHHLAVLLSKSVDGRKHWGVNFKFPIEDTCIVLV